MQALKLIKTDKATSVDCTTDFIVKQLLRLDQEPSNRDIKNFRDNFLEIINDCFINRTIPE